MAGDSSRDGSDSTDTRIAELEDEVERLEARVEKLSARTINIWAFVIGVPLLILLVSLGELGSMLVLLIGAVVVLYGFGQFLRSSSET